MIRHPKPVKSANIFMAKFAEREDIVNSVLQFSIQNLSKQKGTFELLLNDNISTRRISDIVDLFDQFNIFWPDLFGSVHSANNFHNLELKEIAYLLKYIMTSTNLWESAIFKKFLYFNPDEVQSFSMKRLTLDQFQLLKVIGKGCMGKVFLAMEKQSRILYAIKSIHKGWAIKNHQIEHTKTERNILAKLTSIQHPFLANLYGAFQTETDLYLVLEYFPGGDLATQLGNRRRFSESTTKFYAAEIFLGLQELHRIGVIYRDLKPENILLRRNGHVVLSDFGLSKLVENTQKAKTFCGTAEYLAPEILNCQEYDYTVDLWSFGVLLYEMIAGITPFWAEDQMEMYHKVVSGQYRFPAVFSAMAKDLIFQLLQVNPKRRLTGKYIISHAFFSEIDQKKLREFQILPPFIPELASDHDCRHFDDEFTRLIPEVTPSNMTISPSSQALFGGFSFVQ